MALIKCPECGNQISDRAAACIHCGCPIQPQPTTKQISSKSKKVTLLGSYDRSWSLESNFTDILPFTVGSIGKYLYLFGDKVLLNGVSQDYAYYLKERLEKIGLQILIEDSDSEIKFENTKNNSGILCCPKCGCLEYHAGAKGFSVVTGFVGSGKTVITCLHCGNRWKPGK